MCIGCTTQRNGNELQQQQYLHLNGVDVAIAFAVDANALLLLLPLLLLLHFISSSHASPSPSPSMPTRCCCCCCCCCFDRFIKCGKEKRCVIDAAAAAAAGVYGLGLRDSVYCPAGHACGLLLPGLQCTQRMRTRCTCLQRTSCGGGNREAP